MNKPLPAPTRTGRQRCEGSVTENPAKEHPANGGWVQRWGLWLPARPTCKLRVKFWKLLLHLLPLLPAVGPVEKGFCDPGVPPPRAQSWLSLRSTLRVGEASGGEVLKRTGVTGRGCMAAEGLRPSGPPGWAMPSNLSCYRHGSWLPAIEATLGDFSRERNLSKGKWGLLGPWGEPDGDGAQNTGRGSGRKGPSLRGHCLALPRDAGAPRASLPSGTLDPELQHRHSGCWGPLSPLLGFPDDQVQV